MIDSTHRVPPNDQAAEVAVIGGILLNAEALDAVRDELSADAFYVPAHAKLYTALCALRDRNVGIDSVTLRNELTARSWLDECGGAEYLDRIQDEVYTSANIEHHAAIVLDKAALRATAEAAQRIYGLAMSGSETEEEGPLGAAEIIDRSQVFMGEVQVRRQAEHDTNLNPTLSETLEWVDERHAAKHSLPGITTGYPDLDKLCDGLEPETFIILAARPSMGKSALGLNVAENVAMTGKGRVLFHSLEMDKKRLGARLLSSVSRVPIVAMKYGRLTDGDYDRMTDASRMLGELPFVIDDRSGLTVQAVRASARRFAKEHGGIDLLVVDYLQIMQPTRRRDPREQQIAEISLGLKTLGKELKCTVLALAQLSRGLESRSDKRPMLADLRESGSLEQDADQVWFLHRDAYYQKMKPEDEGWDDRFQSEANVAKNRNGETGTASLVWLPAFTRFEQGERKFS